MGNNFKEITQKKGLAIAFFRDAIPYFVQSPVYWLFRISRAQQF